LKGFAKIISFVVFSILFTLASTAVKSTNTNVKAETALLSIDFGGKPVITVDKTTIPVGIESKVIIYASIADKPIAGEKVILQGFGEGITDAQGRVTFTLSPEANTEILINFRGEIYRGQLFAIDENTAVVEIKVKDKQGLYI
jgi:hypothetical protein